MIIGCRHDHVAWNKQNLKNIWSWDADLRHSTTRKLINTNGNTNGIFSSVNFRGILLTKIFPQYIPTELPWENFFKQSKKKRWRVIFTNGIPSVNYEHCSSCQLQRESPTEFSVGIFQRVLFGGFLNKFNYFKIFI